jgi:hypothetical protein
VGKKLKIFILIVLATVALSSCTTRSDSTTVENQTLVSHSDIDVHYFHLDTPNVDLSLPRQISGISNIHRVPNVVKRSGNWHKNNFEFVKSGKVVNVSISNFIQKESLSNLHRFAKSASWLISLGKLII